MTRQMTPRIQELRNELVRRMPIQSAADRATLAGSHITDVLIQYIAWQGRLIRPRKRTVVIWPNVTSSPYFAVHEADVERLKAEFEAGADVNAALSNQVRSNVYAAPLPQNGAGMTHEEWIRKAWRGRDRMRVLLDVHHLHLGAKRPDGTVERTGPLLFTGISQDMAFFIALGDHNSFDNRSISTLMWDTFDAEVAAVGGGAYLPPGGGVTTGGTKVTDTFAAIKIAGILEEIDRQLDAQNMIGTKIQIEWEDIIILDANGHEIYRISGRI